MQHPDTLQFYQTLRARLGKKGYAEIVPQRPLDLGFFKHGSLNLPYVIAALDTSQTSNTPTEIHRGVEAWFKQFHGRTGAGCLLFVYHGEPTISTIEEIQKIGGYITAGAHDLHSGRYWLANHLNWRREIYEE